MKQDFLFPFQDRLRPEQHHLDHEQDQRQEQSQVRLYLFNIHYFIIGMSWQILLFSYEQNDQSFFFSEKLNHFNKKNYFSLLTKQPILFSEKLNQFLNKLYFSHLTKRFYFFSEKLNHFNKKQLNFSHLTKRPILFQQSDDRLDRDHQIQQQDLQS